MTGLLAPTTQSPGSPYQLTPSQCELRDATRRFALCEVSPGATDLDRANEWPRSLWDKIRGLGVTGVSFPQGMGGGGGSYLDFVVMIEQLARSSAAAALLPAVNVLAARALSAYGAPDMQERFLTSLVTGDRKACWAFTEPATGSDPKAIETTAARTADGWVISGQKSFISHSSVADVAVVFARVDGALSAFLVDARQPGWQPGQRYDLLGLRGADTGDLLLDAVEAPPEALLGELGDGMRILLSVESEAKVRSAAMCVGMAQAALDEATTYGLSRLHRGQAIARKFSAIQALLADIDVAAESARALTYHAASRRDAGLDGFERIAAIAKLHASQSAVLASRLAMQVHGAYGYTNDFPIARIYRDAKAYEMIQGSAEIQRVIVARGLLADDRG